MHPVKKRSVSWTLSMATIMWTAFAQPATLPRPTNDQRPPAAEVTQPVPQNRELTPKVPVLAQDNVIQAKREVMPVGGEYGVRVAADLEQRLQPAINLRTLHPANVDFISPSLVRKFYALHGYQPAWIDGIGKPKAIVGELISALTKATDEGLQAEYYHHAILVKSLRSLRMAFRPTVRQLADFDLLLTDAFLSYGSHLLAGRVKARQINPIWKIKPRQRDLTLILEKALASNAIENVFRTLLPTHPSYSRLRTTLADYRALQRAGGWPQISAGRTLDLGARGLRVKQLRARLRASGDLVKVTETEQTYFDEQLDSSVRHFQRRHGLKDDGAVGSGTLAALNVSVGQRIQQIEANLERWRWQPDDLGERHIRVNIPDYRMNLIEGGRNIIDARAIVGRADRPTPLLSASMNYLVLSPNWYVPTTIAVEDKLPLLRKNPYALRQQGIRIFAGQQEIDPGSVNWNRINKKNYTFSLRQDPSRQNALGGVKFMFPNSHAVYIHDTPTRNLFERDKRTFSSGCVRIDTPIELAEYLLRDNADWSRNRIISATKRKRARRVNLPQALPVHLQYWTAWTASDGTVHFRDDIYDLDRRMALALYSS